MITGTLMFDVAITCDNEAKVEELTNAIRNAISPIPGVDSVSKVDEDLSEEEETE